MSRLDDFPGPYTDKKYRIRVARLLIEDETLPLGDVAIVLVQMAYDLSVDHGCTYPPYIDFTTIPYWVLVSFEASDGGPGMDLFHINRLAFAASEWLVACRHAGIEIADDDHPATEDDSGPIDVDDLLMDFDIWNTEASNKFHEADQVLYDAAMETEETDRGPML